MRFRQRPRDPVDLNLTPLIDIVFLLLIFFMVTTTFQREEVLRLKLPSAETGRRVEEGEVLRLTISPEGEFRLEGRRIDRVSLKAALSRFRRSHPRALLVIAADRKSYHGDVIHALDAAKAVGFRRILFAT